MKKLMIISMMFFAILLVTPAWSHHPAEGIVSDEIWDMVDGMLVEADSPHLDIDFEDVMDSTGNTTMMVSSVVVSDDEVADYMEAIDIALDELSANSREMDGALADGDLVTNQNSSITIGVVPLDNDMTEITIYEPIGASSATVPSTPTSAGPAF